MIRDFNLGIVLKDGKIIAHRSFIKVLFNPFLRLIGIQIATMYNKLSNKLTYPTITKCRKKKDINFHYKLERNECILKRRTLI